MYYIYIYIHTRILHTYTHIQIHIYIHIPIYIHTFIYKKTMKTMKKKLVLYSKIKQNQPDRFTKPTWTSMWLPLFDDFFEGCES